MRRVLLYFVVAVVFASCGKQKVTSEEEFFMWINDEDNHLVVERKVDPVVLSVKYLPPAFLSLKELRGNRDANLRDSLTKKYSQSLAFLLTVGLAPDEGKPAGDIMYFNITDQNQYSKRLEDLTFNFCHYIELKTGSNTYVPVLHVFENTYGISPNRTVYLVFSPRGSGDDLLTSDSYDLIFNDQIFSTGISHFKFTRGAIDDIPEICF